MSELLIGCEGIIYFDGIQFLFDISLYKNVKR